MNSRQSSSNNRKAERGDRYQLSLMHVFRTAHASRDAKKDDASYQDGSREMTARSRERRSGTDEGTLRKHLNNDLASLMNTVNLDATESLDDHPYVKKSIVNFGFGDLSHVADTANGPEIITQRIRETLLNYEPRLIAETLEVNIAKNDDKTDQRMTFEISAEMAASPVDIPLEFLAEVDKGAGKVQMTKLKVRT